ncbi:MAG: tetratricopeptide repeat protein [Nitrospirae bacterium]|nr:tetratricopeptide repeat protein [Nitrospirota bacterium]
MGISEKYLESIKAIVSKRSGLNLEGRKGQSLQTAVSTAFSASGCNTIEDYIYLLSTPSYQSRIEVDKLISLLTIKETYFFRDRHQFDVLKKFILPEIINKKRAADKKIKIWSAGCATGEEAYSITIAIFELIPAVESWDISLLATDIDSDALSIAQKGEFKKWSFRGVSEDIIKRYFTIEDDTYRINDRFKKLITFSALNLKEDKFPSIFNNTNNMDIIMCRNVTIYFSREATNEVINKFYNSLNEGGYLLVGHSEHFSEYYKKFAVRAFPHTIVYQRLETPLSSQQQGMNQLGSYPGLTTAFKGVVFRNAQKETLVIEKGYPSGPLHPQKARKASDSEETIIFQEAVQLIKENKYDEAAERLVEILELNPMNARACVMLAQISANRGDVQTALKWCEEAIKIDNLCLDAYYLLSLIFQDSGNFAKAALLLKKVVYINPSHVIGYFDLGMVHKKMNMNTDAKRYFGIAKELLIKESKISAESLENTYSAELIELIEKEIASL